jgi:PPM family protein phosphatase
MALHRYLVAPGSDAGRCRPRQEDAALGVLWTRADDGDDSALVMVVADGMGGAFGGAVASRTAMDALHGGLQARWAEGGLGNDTVWFAAYRDLFADAVKHMVDRARENDNLQQMGTTLTCLAVHANRMTLGHIGDSRAYLYRDGALRRLTTDHNAAAELASEGQIPPEAIATHQSRHVLTRWLAPDTAHPDPELGALQTIPGDAFLVCSDGLHSMVDDNEIQSVLAGSPLDDQASLQRVVDTLIDSANAHGGRDNISVVLGVRLR